MDKNKSALKKEQELLLYVLRRAINGDKSDTYVCNYSQIDWREFVKESVFQAVCYITFENSGFLKSYIPKEIYKKWEQRTLHVIVSNVNVANSQNHLLKILSDKYKYIILKGLTSASYYPNPELRDLGDVDFLIDCNEKDEISDLLINQGYECSGEDNDHHIVFKKPQSHLEMHFEIPGIPYGNIGDKIRIFMADALKERVVVSFNNGVTQDFSAPDSMRHGLILILHMQHHMLGEGLGLRHLVDWACYVNTTVNQPFWDELITFFKEVGIFVYAAAMTKTCALYLGSACPSWCADVSDEICEEIILDIFRLGNFGHKDSEKSRSGSIISDHGKDGTSTKKFNNLWRQFNVSVKSRHKSLEKHKVLYPFFYIYEIFRYIIDSLRGKRPKISKLIRDSEERKSVYEKLHVFEKE